MKDSSNFATVTNQEVEFFRIYNHVQIQKNTFLCSFIVKIVSA